MLLNGVIDTRRRCVSSRST